MVEGSPLCKWNVEKLERVMSEEKSQALVVRLNNTSEGTCESIISLRSPGFDVSPNKEEQSISLSKNKKGSLSWIIIPRKSGSYDLSIFDALDTKIFGITVTNVFGLSAFQAKIVSILGGLFGPMFTIPWWWDRLRGRKKQEPQQ